MLGPIRHKIFITIIDNIYFKRDQRRYAALNLTDSSSTIWSSPLTGVIIGGFVTYIATYLNERRRFDKEEMIRREENDRHRQDLRRVSYVKFLGSLATIDSRSADGMPFYDDAIVLNGAEIFAYGSDAISSELYDHFPNKMFEDAGFRKNFRDAIIEELARMHTDRV